MREPHSKHTIFFGGGVEGWGGGVGRHVSFCVTKHCQLLCMHL